MPSLSQLVSTLYSPNPVLSWVRIGLLLLLVGYQLLPQKRQKIADWFDERCANPELSAWPFYLKVIGNHAILFVVFGLLVGPAAFRLPFGYHLPILLSILVFVGTTIAIGIAFLATRQLNRLAKARSPKEQNLDGLKVVFILPITGIERLTFAAVSICAGISEELVFRGYVLANCAQIGLPVWIAILLASLTFGVVHIYQGMGGLIKTSLIGLVLALVFASTGSMVLIMALHAALDLTNLLRSPEKTKELANQVRQALKQAQTRLESNPA